MFAAQLSQLAKSRISFTNQIRPQKERLNVFGEDFGANPKSGCQDVEPLAGTVEQPQELLLDVVEAKVANPLNLTGQPKMGDGE